MKDSDSEVSLQRLQRPVADIVVNKASRQLRTYDTSENANNGMQRARPKTSENSPRFLSSADYNEPRNRKIIYLMHKRREMALRQAN